MDPLDIRSEVPQYQDRPLLDSSSSALDDQNNSRASVIQPLVNEVSVVQSSSPQSGSPIRMTRKTIQRLSPVSLVNPNDASIPMPLPVSYVLPNTIVDNPKSVLKYKFKAKCNPESVVPKDKAKSKAGDVVIIRVD